VVKLTAYLRRICRMMRGRGQSAPDSTRSHDGFLGSCSVFRKVRGTGI